MKIQIKETVQLIGYFFYDVFGWLRSLFIYLFKSIRKPGIFYGYSSYWFACKYAERRSRKWKSEWDQMGRQQGVFPIGDIKLIVCSHMELKVYKKKGILKSNFKPRKAIKKSYYKTEL